MQIEDTRDALHKALFLMMTAKDKKDERRAKNLVKELGAMLAAEEIEIAAEQVEKELYGDEEEQW